MPFYILLSFKIFFTLNFTTFLRLKNKLLSLRRLFLLLFHFTQLKCETRSKKTKERKKWNRLQWMIQKKQNSETEQAINRKTKNEYLWRNTKTHRAMRNKKKKNRKNGHLTHRIIYVSFSIHSFAYQTKKIEQKNWTCVYLIYCYGYYKYKLPKKNSIFWMYYSLSTQKNNIHRFYHTLSSSFSCTKC